MKKLKYLVVVLLGMLTTMIAAQETATLENYDADIPVLLAELEANAIIPSGAQQAFVQGQSAFNGDRPQFSTFAPENDADNIVMGIALNFDSAATELEFCGIALRVQTNRQDETDDSTQQTQTTIRLTDYVAAGVDHDGLTFAFERGEQPSSDLVLSDDRTDLTETVYLLAIVLNDTLTVYTNGELQISDYPVTRDAGAFAFLYAGTDADSQCEAQSIFAYTFTDEAVGDCTVSSNRPVNQRQAPGTNFAIVTQLRPDSSTPVIGQTTGDDGFTWWLLADDSWVRDDVVVTSGFCRSLPQVSVENN